MSFRGAYLVPNFLSLARLIAGLAFPWLPEGARLPAVCGAIVTDLADGAVSRLLGADSQLGRVLDPIADKVFVAVVIVTLFVEGKLNAAELTLVGLRDALVLLGGIWFATQAGWSALRHMRARLLGKATTGFQFAFLLTVYFELGWGQTILLVATPIVGILAAVDYSLACRRQLAPPQQPESHERQDEQ